MRFRLLAYAGSFFCVILMELNLWENAMLECFFPDEIMDSSYVINYEKLFADGIRGIIYDIDNTLVEHGFPADERSIELIDRLKAIGYKIVFLSNNKEPRVKMFNDAVGAKYIYKANKPAKGGYLRAMEMMGTDTASTIFIGDQIFTDIWGAKKCGIRNILVKPIDRHEEIQIVIKRRLEAIVLYFYYRKNGVR